ncbi:MAG: cyclase family protein [Chloroflexi bacterium]|nr:cyclase family protein [Chloroflexota bacterium]
MSELVDLTLTLGGERMTPVPGLLGVEIEPVHVHERDYRSNSRISMSIHLGTHVDAPYHFVPGGATVDQVPLEQFTGTGILIDLRGRWRRRASIGPAELWGAGVGREQAMDRMAVLFTGWTASESGSTRLYTDNPFLSPEAARSLVEAKVRAVAVDFPVDQSPGDAPPSPHQFPVHRILLGAGIPIIENLVNLDRLVGRQFELWALPLKIHRGNGGATRAVARLL